MRARLSHHAFLRLRELLGHFDRKRILAIVEDKVLEGDYISVDGVEERSHIVDLDEKFGKHIHAVVFIRGEKILVATFLKHDHVLDNIKTGQWRGWFQEKMEAKIGDV